MNRKTLAALLILLGSSYQTAGAADSNAAASSFERMDINRDGRISDLEARTAGLTRSDFQRLDADRDGHISSAEWQAAQAKRGAAGVKGSSR